MSTKLFTIYRRDDALVVAALESIGSLSSANVRTEAEGMMAEMHAAGVKKVIFDLASADYFGSQVIELMILVWRYLAPVKGLLALCRLSPASREVLHISGLDSLWPICDTLEQALAASPPSKGAAGMP